MKRLIKIALSIVVIALSLAGCHKDNLFQGKDTIVASFKLSKGSQVMNAYIINDSIVVTAPGHLSLGGFSATVVVSEHSHISPDPASITDWEQSQQFVVTSENGTQHTYTYVLERNIISKDGDITLMTQADIDTLAKMGLNRINGSLIIGKPAGPDSIRSLSGLTSIKNITGDLIINPTYAGVDLKGLDSVEIVGSFQIGTDINNFQQGALMNLKTVGLPRLKEVMSNMIINGVGATKLDFPALAKVDLGLEVIFVDSLTNVEFPKLESVLQSLTMQGYFTTNSLQTISFPALTHVGGDINVVQWSNLTSVKFPVLALANNFSIAGEAALTTLEAPKLASVLGNVELSNNYALPSMDFSSLKKIGGGLHMEGSTSLENLDGLKSISSIGGDLNIGSLTSVKNINGLKGLTTVGGNFIFQSMDALADDDLDGLSALKNIGGDVTMYGVPFKKFTGFAATQLKSVSIYGGGLSTITNIDLTRLSITDRVMISGVINGASVAGPDVFNGDLTLESCDINMSGFTQVKSFSITDYSGPAAPRPLTISVAKTTGDFFVALTGYTIVKVPNLFEVGGICTIDLYSNMTLNIPSLVKAGSLSMDLAASNMDLLSLPQLTTVTGNCEFITGNHDASVGAIQAPKLTTIAGTLTIHGQEHDHENNRLTNLDGFSTLTGVQGVTVQHSYALVDFSGLKHVISGIGSAQWQVSDNGYNPAFQDMVDGKFIKP